MNTLEQLEARAEFYRQRVNVLGKRLRVARIQFTVALIVAGAFFFFVGFAIDGLTSAIVSVAFVFLFLFAYGLGYGHGIEAGERHLEERMARNSEWEV